MHQLPWLDHRCSSPIARKGGRPFVSYLVSISAGNRDDHAHEEEDLEDCKRAMLVLAT